MLTRLERIFGGFAVPLFLLACAWGLPQAPIDIAPIVPTPAAMPAMRLPPGYHAELASVLILMTAPLQSTSVLADRESLAAVAAAFPAQRVCVLGVDSESIERDVNGGEWYGVLGLFCMPPAQTKSKAGP